MPLTACATGPQRRLQLSSQQSSLDTAGIRRALPSTLEQWRHAKYDGEFNGIWLALQDYLKEHGYILWEYLDLTYFAPPDDLEETCNGFALAPLHRGWGRESRLKHLSQFDSSTALNRPARAVDGRDVVVRVICVGSEGKNHLQVLKYMSRGLCSQATPNHALPLFELFQLEDVVLGVFPRIGHTLRGLYDSWAENSVGDVVDVIMQCLEALGYMHSIGVAHRDAFKDNFLVEWYPESMAEHQLTISRPRVYLNDFETAVYFAPEVPSHERTCVGLPLSPSFPVPDKYTRPVPPEVSSGEPYDPFQLDVWQFGNSLSDLKTQIPEIDSVLRAMVEENPQVRITAFDALKSISRVVNSMTPEDLRISPIVLGR
ncbi:kinase-like domain-containing protein [Trametes maxima]|nr:kinase-like domain-containing protein [Trametes maxima]